MTGLDFPSDLAGWQAWQDRQRGVKARIKRHVDRLRKADRAPLGLTRNSSRPLDLLVALDATTPTAILALIRPLAHLAELSVGVVATTDSVLPLPGGSWNRSSLEIDEVSALGARASAVLALGHYLPIGAAAFGGARPGRFFVVQHGLLTPKAPPLAPGAHLLAWSEADADFWCSGRTDVTATAVGSQLLWEASHDRAAPPAPDTRPVFLGQLHGAELDRELLAASVERFCLDNGASYRPHPAERDRASRARHRKWEAMGMTVDRSGAPLADLTSPVVSAFSTGILEAAARGLPSWSFHLDPPPWLREFWDRYGIHQWGQAPTSAPPRSHVPPAKHIAQILIGLCGTPDSKEHP